MKYKALTFLIFSFYSSLSFGQFNYGNVQQYLDDYEMEQIGFEMINHYRRARKLESINLDYSLSKYADIYNDAYISRRTMSATFHPEAELLMKNVKTKGEELANGSMLKIHSEQLGFTDINEIGVIDFRFMLLNSLANNSSLIEMLANNTITKMGVSVKRYEHWEKNLAIVIILAE